MHGEIVLAGTDEEQLLQEALNQLGLPREAVEYEMEVESEDELLPGAKPQIQMYVRIRTGYVTERAIEHLEAMLDILRIGAEFDVTYRSGIGFVNIESKAAGSLLIGRDGQNLDALQYLINRMVLRVGRESPLVIIDVEGYRQRQFEKLERLAERASQRAIETGNEIELDPMPALERKYLHHYLRSKEGIQTFSRGEEPERYLVILAD